MSGSQAEGARKDLTKQFNDLGLRITIQSKLNIADFLDITLNLNNEKHYPYRKPNDKPLYINRQSDHPPTILNHLPAAISRRLSGISDYEDAFLEAAPLHDNTMKASRYTEKTMTRNNWKEPQLKQS